MNIKSKIEAIIYAAEEPISEQQIVALLRNELINEEGAKLGDAEAKAQVRSGIEALVADYESTEHGIEVRQVAGGYRMATKPEHHDLIRSFAKSLKPPIRLSLQALETLAVIAYKQPVTVPEISEIRGVDASGVIGTLLERKLITTAGRKAVIGRPILYKTTKEFLLRFGLSDVGELPSMDEFEKLASDAMAADMGGLPDATGVPEVVEAQAIAEVPSEALDEESEGERAASNASSSNSGAAPEEVMHAQEETNAPVNEP
jgi:segregation and condensation protein B